MDALVKASLYLGTVFLVGAGAYVYFISRHSRPSRLLITVVLAGLGFIILGSISNLTLTVMHALGSRFNTAFLWDYATSTQHGRVTFVRLMLGVLLVPLILLRRWPQFQVMLFSLTGLGFLATFSILSHATTMQGTPALIADLIHFSSATLWVGAVLFSVLHRVWRLPEFEYIMKRVSNTALVCVIVLVVTGIYTSLLHINMIPFSVSSDVHTSLLHINMIPFFIDSDYGRILLAKVSVFSLILVLAALNRWYFMPNLLSKRVLFQRVLMVEVFLLVAVLIITGLLTVSPIPHDMTK
jgi:putative copper export protein